MTKKTFVLGMSYLLAGCQIPPYVQAAIDNSKQIIDNVVNPEAEKNKKICSIIHKEFLNTSNPWKSYKNAAEKMYLQIISEIGEEKKEMAKAEFEKDVKNKFAKINTQAAIDQELSNFENDVKTKEGFDCSPETQALVTRKLDEYWDKLNKEDEDKRIKEYDAQIKSIEKKYGYKFCPEPSDMTSYFITGRPLPSSCILVAGEQQFLVFQQVSGGTLLQARTVNYFPGQVVFVSHNKTDAEMPDNVAAPGGYFVRTGSFNYSSVLGAGKTVYKLKRLEAF